MTSFRRIEREHIIVRRSEADACLHYLLHHSATLTACSAAELLLEFLVSNLHKKLDQVKKRQAKSLMADVRNEEARTGAKVQYWGLNSWVQLYRKRSILEKLDKHLDLHFKLLNVATLTDVNEVWNRCKHDPFLASHDIAHEMVGLLHSFLSEAQIKPETNSLRAFSVGHMSAQWLGKNGKNRFCVGLQIIRTRRHSDILLYLVPLLDLFVRLIDDERVDYKHKSALMVAANYVFQLL